MTNVDWLTRSRRSRDSFRLLPRKRNTLTAVAESPRGFVLLPSTAWCAGNGVTSHTIPSLEVACHAVNSSAARSAKFPVIPFDILTWQFSARWRAMRRDRKAMSICSSSSRGQSACFAFWRMLVMFQCSVMHRDPTVSHQLTGLSSGPAICPKWPGGSAAMSWITCAAYQMTTS